MANDFVLKKIIWSDPFPPNDVDCRYDHVKAYCGLGDARIEWKSWKENDTRCLYLNGDYIGSASTLDAAKDLLVAHIHGIVSSLVA
jgi:hypothetical protein